MKSFLIYLQHRKYLAAHQVVVWAILHRVTNKLLVFQPETPRLIFALTRYRPQFDRLPEIPLGIMHILPPRGILHPQLLAVARVSLNRNFVCHNFISLPVLTIIGSSENHLVLEHDSYSCLKL